MAVWFLIVGVLPTISTDDWSSQRISIVLSVGLVANVLPDVEYRPPLLFYSWRLEQ